MHRNPTPPDTAPHPEAGENRRLGSQVFQAVRAEYFIDQDTLPVIQAGRKTVIVVAGSHPDATATAVDVVLGRGRHTHWYAPFVHAELPGELAKLREADAEKILDFVHTYGQLGFSWLVRTLEEATHLNRQTGRREAGGDPLPWIRAHAWGVYICLTLTEALASRTSGDALRSLLDSWNGVLYAEAAEMNQVQIGWRRETPTEMARRLRASIINRNLRGVSRYVSVDDQGKDRSFFQYDAPVSVAYWHLVNLIDSGTVKRCEAEGCGGVFIQTDPRQRYCPKRWRQRESSCATRQRQRDARR
jgi:hypothetical protein